MKSRCIHVMGASGSGAASLGRALSGAVALPHHDADDYSRPLSELVADIRAALD